MPAIIGSGPAISGTRLLRIPTSPQFRIQPLSEEAPSAIEKGFQILPLTDGFTVALGISGALSKCVLKGTEGSYLILAPSITGLVDFPDTLKLDFRSLAKDTAYYIFLAVDDTASFPYLDVWVLTDAEYESSVSALEDWVLVGKIQLPNTWSQINPSLISYRGVTTGGLEWDRDAPLTAPRTLILDRVPIRADMFLDPSFGSNGIASVDSTERFAGEDSLRLESPSAVQNLFSGEIASVSLPVGGGQSVTAEFYARTSTPSTTAYGSTGNGFRLNWFQSDGTLLSSVLEPADMSFIGSDWTRISASFTAPQGASLLQWAPSVNFRTGVLHIAGGRLFTEVEDNREVPNPTPDFPPRSYEPISGHYYSEPGDPGNAIRVSIDSGDFLVIPQSTAGTGTVQVGESGNELGLTVSGEALIEGAATVDSDLTVNGDFNVQGTVTSDLDASGHEVSALRVNTPEVSTPNLRVSASSSVLGAVTSYNAIAARGTLVLVPPKTWTLELLGGYNIDVSATIIAGGSDSAPELPLEIPLESTFFHPIDPVTDIHAAATITANYYVASDGPAVPGVTVHPVVIDDSGTTKVVLRIKDSAGDYDPDPGDRIHFILSGHLDV